MLLLLTVCFYFFTAASAILGIAAQAWAKDKPVLANRVRWGSIGCIILILFVNVWKEYLIDIKAEEERAKNEKLQGTIDSQSNEVRYLRAELKEANVTINETRKKLVEAQLASKRTTEAIQPHAQKRLSGATRAYLTFIRDLLFFGSDGWIPKNEEEFFSLRAAAVICGQLDISKLAPVLPARSWRNWIAESANQYRKALDEILRDYPGFLDSELVRKITLVDNLTLFTLSTSLLLTPQINRELGVRFPPLICKGVETAIEKDLIALFSLYKEIRLNERRYGFTGDWNFLNMASDKRWPRHLLGSDRFTTPAAAPGP